MSQKFPGGFITKSPVAPTTSAASGIWTLDQQEQYQKAGTWPQQPPPPYIEDVFSTYLYNGNDSTQTITNGIDLSTKGGLVWIKSRNLAGTGQFFQDTVRGANQFLDSTTTGANQNIAAVNTTFSTTGFSQNNNYLSFNGSGYTYASWTFRKQPKFFDVVTWTGTGSTQTISHNLGSAPGCIIVKRTDAVSNWRVYHRGLSLPNESWMHLNTTDASFTSGGTNIWNVTSTTFQADTYLGLSTSGATYVAYLFAHNAGGFGATETENVISCGSFTSDGSGLATINLGYEAQWVLIKNSGAVGDWEIYDTIRGMSYSSAYWLRANLSSAEANVGSNTVFPTATGFSYNGFAASQTGIYIAIRRGPMKTPTSGTSVYASAIQTSSSSVYDLNFSSLTYLDALISWKDITYIGPTGVYNEPMWNDRLRGFPINMTGSTQVNNPGLSSSATNAEDTGANPNSSNYLSGVTMNRAIWGGGWSGYSGVFHTFKRAPSFFDEVCYTGNATSGATQTHNLGVTPEMIIVKNRSAAGYDWFVYHKNLTSAAYYLNLNSTAAESQYWNAWNSTQPTSSVFTIGNYSAVNASGNTYVAYLFASCAGVSKIGSYTGNGSSQIINCGFTGGARFVMIKRTDSTGNWYVWNTAQGMISGNDKYLLINTRGQPVTSNLVYTTTTGFEIVTGTTEINASGGSYIYLAIA